MPGFLARFITALFIPFGWALIIILYHRSAARDTRAPRGRFYSDPYFWLWLGQAVGLAILFGQ